MRGCIKIRSKAARKGGKGEDGAKILRWQSFFSLSFGRVSGISVTLTAFKSFYLLFAISTMLKLLLYFCDSYISRVFVRTIFSQYKYVVFNNSYVPSGLCTTYFHSVQINIVVQQFLRLSKLSADNFHSVQLFTVSQRLIRLSCLCTDYVD